MSLQCQISPIPEVILVEPVVFKDDRGFFLESYHQIKYGEKGIAPVFVQDNHSHSRQGTIRGLHYQLKHPQGKLIYVICGHILDVVLDIRRGSPTFGNWCGAHLSADNRHQVFVPEGFAHGFSVLSESADVIYKCTDFYTPGDEYGVLWNDPALDIDWEVEAPLLSEKDTANPALNDIALDMLPVYDGAESPGS
jgi:dTDP-4-dehydrorhamnose 3,5-epimerase